jgi:hypothetical protein
MSSALEIMGDSAFASAADLQLEFNREINYINQNYPYEHMIWVLDTKFGDTWMGDDNKKIKELIAEFQP